MESDIKNISNLEAYLYSMLYSKVSDNVFFTELPPAINRKWTEMLLVDCQINDMSAYGDGYVYVYIYTKPKPNGTKNVGLIAELESKMNSILLKKDDKHYILSINNRESDYDEKRDLFINVTIFNLIII